MICLFNKYKKSVQKRTDFFDNSFFNAVPDKPLATRNKPHNNQLCADLSRFISAYPVVSHFLRFAWQTTSAGASGDKLSGEDAKTQFYSMIDKPFRDWLSQLDTSYDIDEYTGKIEDTVRKIAIVFGNDCVHQMSANTIFGRYEKDGKDKNLVTTVEALNIFNATINKIFRKEGDNK